MQSPPPDAPDGPWPPGFEPPPRPGTETLSQLAPEVEAWQRRPRWWLRGSLSLIALGLLLVAIGGGLSACQASGLLEEARAERPRDGQTGILLGAEERRLNAPQARGAVLLLHGFSSTPADWSDLPEQLADAGWSVHVPLLPGHGTYAEDLATTLNGDLRAASLAAYDALAATHSTVVVGGFSMGGALALEVAAERPVKHLLLVAPFFRISRPWYSPLPVSALNRFAGLFLDYLPVGKQGAHRINNKANASQVINYWALPTASVARLGNLGREAAERASEVQARVWMAVSENDSAASPAAAKAVFENCPHPDNELLVVRGSDHVLTYDYDVEQVFSALLEHLAGI